MEDRNNVFLYQDGKQIDAIQLSNDDWETINFIDDINLDELADLIDAQGLAIVSLALSHFGRTL